MIGKRQFLAHSARLALMTSIGAGGTLGAIRRVLAAGTGPVAPGVYRLNGSARINGKPAVYGMPVAPGDTVETDAGGEIIYVIGQDAFLQRENSVVRFVGDATADFMRVISGKLLAVFGKGSKTVRTPTATLGIRGTGCYIEAEPERTYFCLCYGEVEVAPDATPGKVHRYETKHHDLPYYIGKEAGLAMVPASVINHSDSELTLLESLCGRRTPFHGMAKGSYVNNY